MDADLNFQSSISSVTKSSSFHLKDESLQFIQNNDAQILTRLMCCTHLLLHWFECCCCSIVMASTVHAHQLCDATTFIETSNISIFTDIHLPQLYIYLKKILNIKPKLWCTTYIRAGSSVTVAVGPAMGLMVGSNRCHYLERFYYFAISGCSMMDEQGGTFAEPEYSQHRRPRTPRTPHTPTPLGLSQAQEIVKELNLVWWMGELFLLCFWPE